jgi:hypothetical protein
MPFQEHSGILIDGVQKATMLQCPHCGCHFKSVPGSGHKRAFCFRCMAVCCGAEVCNTCVPLEAQLEHREGTKTLYDDIIKDLIAKGASVI